MSGFFESRRIAVTGGGGFLGSYLLAKLSERGARDVFVPHYPEYDLTDRAAIGRLTAATAKNP